MARQLNIRSDEAYHLAHAIADDTGRPVVDIIVQALRDYGASLPKRSEMTPEQRALYDQLRQLARETSRRRKPGVVWSDNSDMYDEFGLPI